LGGARSGKSRFAQALCPADGRVTYVATARVEDAEMGARVARHRRERPAEWVTVEEPLELSRVVRAAAAESECVLVDCLTVWLANLAWAHPGEGVEERAYAELERLPAGPRVILVSNEVGGGVVPETEVGRRFRDLQGFVNQRAAALCDEVYLTVAGLPLQLKGVRR